MGKYVIQSAKSGLRFDLRTAGGEVILSGEAYHSLRSCKNGIASVMRNAPIAALEDQTAADCEEQKCPKFELYADRAGAYRFRLKAKNGQIIGVSAPYQRRSGCLGGIDAVRRNGNSGIEDRRGDG